MPYGGTIQRQYGWNATMHTMERKIKKLNSSNLTIWVTEFLILPIGQTPPGCFPNTTLQSIYGRLTQPDLNVLGFTLLLQPWWDTVFWSPTIRHLAQPSNCGMGLQLLLDIVDYATKPSEDGHVAIIHICHIYYPLSIRPTILLSWLGSSHGWGAIFELLRSVERSNKDSAWTIQGLTIMWGRFPMKWATGRL